MKRPVRFAAPIRRLDRTVFLWRLKQQKIVAETCISTAIKLY